jgi:large subunit ribosomal protein L10
MPKSKIQKGEILRTVQTKVEQMKAAVFVNFSGISVKEIDALRSECRKEGIDYLVTKKTLLRKALTDKGLGDETAHQSLEGEVATLFSYQDEVAAAKLVSVFAKKQDKLKIVGGVVSGALIGKEQVMALSKLPSKQELLAKAVGSIAAPLSGMVNVLQGNLRGLVYTLSAIKDKKA